MLGSQAPVHTRTMSFNLSAFEEFSARLPTSICTTSYKARTSGGRSAPACAGDVKFVGRVEWSVAVTTLSSPCEYVSIRSAQWSQQTRSRRWSAEPAAVAKPVTMFHTTRAGIGIPVAHENKGIPASLIPTNHWAPPSTLSPEGSWALAPPPAAAAAIDSHKLATQLAAQLPVQTAQWAEANFERLRGTHTARSAYHVWYPPSTGYTRPEAETAPGSTARTTAREIPRGLLSFESVDIMTYVVKRSFGQCHGVHSD